jgi:hypothetical protein
MAPRPGAGPRTTPSAGQARQLEDAEVSHPVLQKVWKHLYSYPPSPQRHSYVIPSVSKSRSRPRRRKPVSRFVALSTPCLPCTHTGTRASFFPLPTYFSPAIAETAITAFHNAVASLSFRPSVSGPVSLFPTFCRVASKQNPHVFQLVCTLSLTPRDFEFMGTPLTNQHAPSNVWRAAE